VIPTWTKTPPAEIPWTNTPPAEVPWTNTPPAEVPWTNTPPAEVPWTNTPPAEFPWTNTPQSEVPWTNTPPVEVPWTNTPQAEVSNMLSLYVGCIIIIHYTYFRIRHSCQLPYIQSLPSADNINTWVHSQLYGGVRVSLYRCSQILVEETWEKHRPASNHWHTLSHTVVSSTPQHERDSNSHWLHR
jgi:hypothetical protein